MTTAVQIVASLAWIGVGILIFILWRIARFYELSSGRRAFSYLFLPPMLLLPAAAIYYAVTDVDFVGSATADLLFFVGAIFLIVATVLLEDIMVGRR